MSQEQASAVRVSAVDGTVTSLAAAAAPNIALGRKRMLLALFDSTPAVASLRRALALSQRSGAELHVLRVLPEPASSGALFSAQRVPDVIGQLARSLRAARETKAWLADVMGEEAARARLRVRSGTFIEEVAAHALELGANLIIVPPRERFGSTVTGLARAAQVPVLVGTVERVDRAIVAATDLADPGYPVLRIAAELRDQCGALVVAVHNVKPVSLVVDPVVAWPSVVLPGDGARRACKSRLARESERLQLGAESVVACELNPVDAILGEARVQDADLVVVGTRARSWLGQLLGASVAAQVVDRADRSVLVTPLPPVGIAFAQAKVRTVQSY